MDKLVSEYFSAIESGSSASWAEAHRTVFTSQTFHNEFCKQLKLRDQAKYVYMITFTLDPSKWPEVADELCEEVEEYIAAQGTRKGLQIVEYHYVKEYHKNGRPHWHVSVISTKSLKKSLFKYYQQKYGNIDFSRTKGKNNLDTLEYLSKSGTVKRVV